jgi:hypothetical protein
MTCIDGAERLNVLMKFRSDCISFTHGSHQKQLLREMSDEDKTNFLVKIKLPIHVYQNLTEEDILRVRNCFNNRFPAPPPPSPSLPSSKPNATSESTCLGNLSATGGLGQGVTPFTSFAPKRPLGQGDGDITAFKKLKTTVQT